MLQYPQAHVKNEKREFTSCDTTRAYSAGSTNPGLLGFAIDKFSQVFPDYRQRVLSHEAAHFLIGYLLGVPVTGYSLSIGKEHVDFVEARIQQRLFQVCWLHGGNDTCHRCMSWTIS
jgi:hypothetical protein